ncbi:unnamed protein product [Clonostachys rosea f. rosea IK726]|uniref:Uncharacterized protein n=1 Tax=Clonostachys rosea f. rosea IK726 TaxID=1349383 RepID=A0ACA9UB71_BIOOC|nr:unnamed protein product [Clonostachys rosea f. rosea IK726]
MSTPYLMSYTNEYSFARGATRVGDAAQAADNHRSKALAEIDGLFAGFQYLERTEGNQNSSARPFNASTFMPDQVSFDDFERDLNGTIAQPDLADSNNLHQDEDRAADSEGQPSRCDWSSIRDVMEGSEHHWRSFQQLAEKLNLPAVNKIRNQYENPRGLREAGVFAFRETLSGAAPKDLKGVFAFASLSFVVSQLLCSRGRIAKQEILKGIKVWRDAIQDQEEREVFLKLAEELWPEAKVHFHFIPLNLTPKHLDRLHNLSSFGNHYWQPQDEYAATSTAHFSEDQQGHTSQLASNVDSNAPESFNILPTHGSFTDQEYAIQLLEEYDGLPMCEQVTRMTDCTRELWRWHESSFHLSNDSGSIGATATPDHLPLRDGLSLTNNTSGKPPDPGHDPPDAPTCEQLQSTAVFCAVSTYLFNFSRFFYLLSGGGLSAKSLHSIKAFNVENTYLKDNILDMYLEPLKNNGITLSSQSLAIWAVARKFVKLGCLQSVQEVQDYLMTVGREILPTGQPFTQFSRWVYSIAEGPLVSVSSPSCISTPKGGRIRKKKSYKDLRVRDLSKTVRQLNKFIKTSQ